MIAAHHPRKPTLGNDGIRGGAGNHSLYGQRDKDKLFGDDGEDEQFGALRSDELDGGAGSDILIGEHGARRYDGWSPLLNTMLLIWHKHIVLEEVGNVVSTQRISSKLDIEDAVTHAEAFLENWSFVFITAAKWSVMRT